MECVRTKLIDATFEEVFQKGYKGTSLSQILTRADVKKGAMYHHFPSKKEMVLAMIEEKVEKRIENKWKILKNSDDNILEVFASILENTNLWDLAKGCPLGNLLQESLDDDNDFKIKLTNILDKWKDLFSTALKKAKQNNELKEDVNVYRLSTFLIASIEGALLVAKKYEDPKDFDICIQELIKYLNSLKK